MSSNACLVKFSQRSLFLSIILLITGALFPSFLTSSTQAQVAPITSSGLNTQVSAPIAVGAQTQYNITGGTRAGTNLFHSFGQFNVPNNNIANFFNDSGLNTSNILGRVTGGNISNIFGLIQTTGFGNANLFLMNPAGFLFGPNATLNVGGMVAFTTADYLRLQGNGGNGMFYADPAQPSILTSSPVAAYGFLGSNPNAFITVQGSQLSVADGQSIALVGGNIAIQSGTPDGGTAQPAQLSAPNGKILLASAASPGEFNAATLQPLPNIANASFTSFGSVSLAPGSSINVSGANTVSIKGGQFVLSVNDAVLSTSQTAAPPETISLSTGSSIVTSNSGADPGADIQLLASNVQMDGASVQSLATGDGAGGNISIGGQTISLVNGAQIVSSTSGAGTGGDITVAATDSVSISGYDTTGTLSGVALVGIVTSGIFSTASSGGNGGQISITAPTVTVDNAGTLATITSGDGQGGNISVNAQTVRFTNGAFVMSSSGVDFATGDVVGAGRGGDITVKASDSILLSGSNFDVSGPSIIFSQTFNGQRGGNILVSAPTITLDAGVSILTDAEGTGAGGNITINAPNQLSLSGVEPVFELPSQIFTATGSDGQAGTINVTAGTVNVANGAQIHSESFGAGNSGDLTFHVLNDMSITGASKIASVGGANSSGNISITADRLFISGTDPVTFNVDNENGGTGAIGNIAINVRQLVLTDNGRINSAGANGSENISISASESVTVSDGAKIRMVNESGPGGLLEITSPTITMDQGILQTLTAGPGSAGAINLHADNLTLSGSIINSTTQGGSGRGGDVTVTVTDMLAISGRFNGSSIESPNPAGIYTSSLSSRGDAGRISVSAGTVELSGGARIDSSTSSGSGKGGAITVNADNMISLTGPGTGMFSQANGGTGGGGAITVQSPLVQITNGAVISATSTGSGAAGTVTIEGTASPAQSVLIDGAGSGVFTTTSGTGAGGNIFVNANTVTLQNGGTLSAATSGTAPTATGGTVTIEGNTVQLNSAATITTATSGSGNAGDILMKADIFSMNGGATITASSTGSGNAGNVTIQGLARPAQSVLIDGTGSGIFTDTDATGAGGNILVNANAVTLSNGGTLSATTSGTAASATGGTITIAATDVQLSNNASITTVTTGAGDAGAITITAGDSVSLLTGSSISSSSPLGFSNGNGGPVTITAPTVSLHDSSIVTFAEAFGSEFSTAGAGAVTINASSSLSLVNGTIDSHVTDTAGNAGQILITSPSVSLSNASTISSAFFTNSFSPDGSPVGLPTDGNGGHVELAVGQLSLAGRSVITAETNGGGQGGSVTVHGLAGLDSPASDVTITSGASIRTDATDIGSAGNIKIDTARLAVTGGGQIQATTIGPGAGGTITIRATEQVTVSGEVLNCLDCAVGARTLPSQITASSSQFDGRAGDILVQTPSLTLADGGRIVASTFGAGQGGTVTVQGLQGAGSMATSFLASGQSSEGAVSGIFTNTSGTGAGGNIFVNANTVTLQNGGTLSAATSGTAPSATGGAITVNAYQVQLNSGGLITASTTGAGTGGLITIGADSTFASDAGTISSTATQATGGDINITAGQSVTLNNGSLITASSTGLGNAGNILINAGQNYTSTDSKVTTQAALASGGNITLLATDTVLLNNSQLNASVQGSSTTVGGNITIDPQKVILLNSQILAQATQGQGGQISINITNGGLFLPSANSTVSASSEFGVDGTVTIQSPISPASGKIIPLSQKPLLATSLLNQRCAAMAGGEFSSFTLAGRDSLPTEPGGWLPSPPAFGMAGTNVGRVAEGAGFDAPTSETTVLSLRRMAPAGFLTQTFVLGESAGCAS